MWPRRSGIGVHAAIDLGWNHHLLRQEAQRAERQWDDRRIPGRFPKPIAYAELEPFLFADLVTDLVTQRDDLTEWKPIGRALPDSIDVADSRAVRFAFDVADAEPRPDDPPAHPHSGIARSPHRQRRTRLR